MCGLCDFVSDDETDIYVHVTSNHKFRCNTCNSEFKSEKKIKEHTCRIYIENPEFGEYYMKNWIIANSCARIFSKSLSRDILFLHTEQCIEKVKSCPDLLVYYDKDMVNYDGAIWHAPIYLKAE